MKNLWCIILMLGGGHSFSQTNVFPANGNVGIGTIAPTNKLVVQGEIRINNNYPYLYLNSGFWGGGTYLQNGVTSGGGANGNYMLFLNPANKAFNFRQGGLDAFTIHTNGFVGIGTTAPAVKLDVQGDIRWGGAGSMLKIDQGGSID